MIHAKEFPNKSFFSKEELFDSLKRHEKDLISSKKMKGKEADAVYCQIQPLNEKGDAIKADTLDPTSIDRMRAKLVINTTYLFDSHLDVHINGLWSKTLKEKKDLYLLKEHGMRFENIISDMVKAKTENTTFKDLGFDLDGDTQALIFDVIIEKSRNPYMFDQYAKGYVKNHSVGMRYVKIKLAINSEAEGDAPYKEVWDKYYDKIANKEDVDQKGYFWAVLEAKIVEGSAVVKGSNWATPTQSIEEIKDEAGETTSTKQKEEPSCDTHEFINVNLY